MQLFSSFSGSQQFNSGVARWVALSTYNLDHCHHGHFGHEHLSSTGWVILSSRVTFDECLRKTQIALHSLSIWRSLSTYLFPKYLCYQFLLCSFQGPNIWPEHWLQPMNQYKVPHLAILPSSKNVALGGLPDVLPTVKISLPHCPSGMSRKGAVMLQLSPCRW